MQLRRRRRTRPAALPRCRSPGRAPGRSVPRSSSTCVCCDSPSRSRGSPRLRRRRHEDRREDLHGRLAHRRRLGCAVARYASRPVRRPGRGRTLEARQASPSGSRADARGAARRARRGLSAAGRRRIVDELELGQQAVESRIEQRPPWIRRGCRAPSADAPSRSATARIVKAPIPSSLSTLAGSGDDLRSRQAVARAGASAVSIPTLAYNLPCTLCYTHMNPISRIPTPIRWILLGLSFPIGGFIVFLDPRPVTSPVLALAGGFIAGIVIGAAEAFALRVPMVRWTVATAVGLGARKLLAALVAPLLGAGIAHEPSSPRSSRASVTTAAQSARRAPARRACCGLHVHTAGWVDRLAGQPRDRDQRQSGLHHLRRERCAGLHARHVPGRPIRRTSCDARPR